jgi:major membrane immunogen (membrane-anchored lipoprotein)
MKTIPTILALSLLLTACGRHDAQLRKQITGTWADDRPGSLGTMTLASDGSFSSRWRTPNHTNTWEGTWQISDGVLIMTNTKSNDVPITTISHDKNKIIRVDDHVLTCEIDYLGNQTISYHR